MKKLLFALFLFLAMPTAPALAAPPVESPLLSHTSAITLPFDFEIIDYSDSTAPELPDISIADTETINLIGSIALTMYSLIDASIIGIFLVLLLAVLAMFWLWRFVTDEPTEGVALKQLDFSDDAAALGSEIVDSRAGQQYLNNTRFGGQLRGRSTRRLYRRARSGWRRLRP